MTDGLPRRQVWQLASAVRLEAEGLYEQGCDLTEHTHRRMGKDTRQSVETTLKCATVLCNPAYNDDMFILLSLSRSSRRPC